MVPSVLPLSPLAITRPPPAVGESPGDTSLVRFTGVPKAWVRGFPNPPGRMGRLPALLGPC